ncbi:hypothetical protein CR513_47121, partial [Mucuna pruriens]
MPFSPLRHTRLFTCLEAEALYAPNMVSCFASCKLLLDDMDPKGLELEICSLPNLVANKDKYSLKI